MFPSAQVHRTTAGTAPTTLGVTWLVALTFLATEPACTSDSTGDRDGTNVDSIERMLGPGAIEAVLAPRVLIGGEWMGREKGLKLDLVMAEGPAGYLVEARFEATEDISLEGIELKGHVTLPQSTVKGWVSNGFQSWSQSGVVALQSPKTDDKLALDLSIIGDGETIRKGDSFSWWGTWIGGGAHTVGVGVTAAKRWKSVVAPYRDGDYVGLRLISGWTGERLELKAGDVITSAQWSISFDDFEAWPKAMKARHPMGELPAAEAGWNSWYELWDSVDATAVVENAALARQVLEPPLKILTADGKKVPPLRIVVDDGWQKNWGDWQPNAKFPKGLDGLAKQLKSDGFEMGVWLAPLLAAASSDVYKKHKDWFLDEPTFPHLKMGKMHVLDVTHPDAAKHLAGVIKTIVGWGYSLLKIDFLFAGTWEGKRHQPVTGVEAYREALRIIREAAGEDVLLLAVGAPALPTVEWVDMWRVGMDIAVEPFTDPHFPFVANQLRMIGARWPLCRRMLCDPDPAMLRSMPDNEVEFGIWVVSLAGGGLFLSDDLRKLPKERLAWKLDATLDVWPALSGQVTVPRATFVEQAPLTLVNPAFDHLQKLSRHVVPVVWPGPSGDVAANTTAKALDVDGIVVPAHSIARISP